MGGFSQGGAMSLAYAMQAEKPIGGVICFSGYLFKTIPLINVDKFPVLLMHGNADPLVR